MFNIDQAESLKVLIKRIVMHSFIIFGPVLLVSFLRQTH